MNDTGLEFSGVKKLNIEHIIRNNQCKITRH